jgi:hypothetical protein
MKHPHPKDSSCKRFRHRLHIGYSFHCLWNGQWSGWT